MTEKTKAKPKKRPDLSTRDADICSLYTQGMRQTKIAALFGITQARVSQILKR